MKIYHVLWFHMNNYLKIKEENFTVLVVVFYVLAQVTIISHNTVETLGTD